MQSESYSSIISSGEEAIGAIGRLTSTMSSSPPHLSLQIRSNRSSRGRKGVEEEERYSSMRGSATSACARPKALRIKRAGISGRFSARKESKSSALGERNGNTITVCEESGQWTIQEEGRRKDPKAYPMIRIISAIAVSAAAWLMTISKESGRPRANAKLQLVSRCEKWDEFNERSCSP